MNFIHLREYVFISGFKFALRDNQPFTLARNRSQSRFSQIETDDIQDRYYEPDMLGDWRKRHAAQQEWIRNIGINQYGEWYRHRMRVRGENVIELYADHDPSEPEFVYFLPGVNDVGKIRIVGIAHRAVEVLREELQDPTIQVIMREMKDEHSSFFVDYIKVSMDNLVLLSLIGNHAVL